MAPKKPEPSSPGSPAIRNKKAHFNYHVEEAVEAGLALLGSEVKSLRAGKGNLDEAYARPRGSELYLYNMHIGPYEQAATPHDPRRPRKLLLHRREIRRLAGRVAAKGFALVPLKVYWKRGLAKVELALATGKRQFDKREDIRQREAKREIDRHMSARRARRRVDRGD